jgi:hypothetical protein
MVASLLELAVLAWVVALVAPVVAAAAEVDDEDFESLPHAAIRTAAATPTTKNIGRLLRDRSGTQM